MQPRAQVVGTIRSWTGKKAGRTLPQGPQRKRSPPDTPISDFQPPELQEKFCCFLPCAQGHGGAQVIEV